MDNPFTKLDSRLTRIENLLLELRKPPFPAKSQDKLHSITSLANHAGVHYQTIRNWIDAGKLPFKQIGRRKFIYQSTFDKCLKDVKSLKYKR